MRGQSLHGRIGYLVTEVVDIVRLCLARAVEIELVDRAVALASLAFTALIPLGVVTGSVLPSVGSRDLADSFIHRFRLSGDTAELVRSLFAPPEDVRSAVSFIGLFLLVVSALSFTRAMQRVYERSWQLRSRGVRGTPAGLAWLAGVVVFLAFFAGIRAELVNATGDLVGVVVALAFSFAIWVLTPYTLLGRRVHWRALLPTSCLTAVAMTALNTGAIVYMPNAIHDSAARYGQIGVAIALVSFLVAVGFVLVTCAAVGAVLAERFELADAAGVQDVPPSS
jgi:membrane protein